MKMERHSKIVELIGKYEIETQEELAEYLNKEGYNVTQATVSRDIRELKLSKIQTENGGQKYAVFHPQTAFNDKYTRILHDIFPQNLRFCGSPELSGSRGVTCRKHILWRRRFNFQGTQGDSPLNR